MNPTDLKVKFTRTWVVLCVFMGTLGLSAQSAQATFPGENGKIVFSSRPDGNAEILAMNSDGSDVTNLTNHPAFDREPSVSADAQRVAFSSNREGGNVDIFAMDADGSSPARLTTAAAQDVEPSFSPDGQKIAFRSDRDGNGNIYITDADGSDQVQLTNSAALDFQPAFSPDGDKIAFTTQRDGNFEIYVMDVDGTNEVNVTNSPFHESRPSFSPDGEKIAFTTDRDGNFEIYVMNDVGTNPQRLTTNTALDSEPVFSPEGDKIAFMSNRDGNNEIYVKGVVFETRLTSNTITDELPSWGVADTTAPTVTITTPADASNTRDTTPTIAGTGGTDALDGPVFVKIYKGVNPDGVAIQVHELVVAEDGTWSVDADKLRRRRTYTVQAEQSDTEGHTGISAPVTFRLKQ